MFQVYAETGYISKPPSRADLGCSRALFRTSASLTISASVPTGQAPLGLPSRIPAESGGTARAGVQGRGAGQAEPAGCRVAEEGPGSSGCEHGPAAKSAARPRQRGELGDTR